MTNNQLTTERLEIMLAETLGTTAARGENASIEVNASIFVSVLTEVLARRKAEAAWNKFQSLLNPDDPAAAEPCPRCGVTPMRLNGEHYCHVKTGEID